MKRFYILVLSCVIILSACGKTVTVNIPAGLFTEGGAESMAEQFRNTEGFKSVDINDDGSMTVTVTEKKYEAQKESVNNMAEQLYNAVGQEGGYLQTVKKIDYNEDYTHLTITLDREAYEASEEGESVEQIIYVSRMYQVFSLNNDAVITVDYIDEKSGENYMTERYTAEGIYNGDEGETVV